MSNESGDITHHSILCGICKSPVSPRDETEPDGEVGCAPCNNWAPKDEVVEAAKKYVIDQAQLTLNRQMRDIARDSKMMTFSGDTVADKQYRFTTDGKF